MRAAPYAGKALRGSRKLSHPDYTANPRFFKWFFTKSEIRFSKYGEFVTARKVECGPLRKEKKKFLKCNQFITVVRYTTKGKKKEYRGAPEIWEGLHRKRK